MPLPPSVDGGRAFSMYGKLRNMDRVSSMFCGLGRAQPAFQKGEKHGAKLQKACPSGKSYGIRLSDGSVYVHSVRGAHLRVPVRQRLARHGRDRRIQISERKKMEARRGHLRHFPDDSGQHLCDGGRTGAGRADCAADGDLSGVLLPEKSVSHCQACGRAAGGHSVGRLRLLQHCGAGADGARAERTVGRKRQVDAHGVHPAGNHDSADHHRRGRACPSRRSEKLLRGRAGSGRNA